MITDDETIPFTWKQRVKILDTLSANKVGNKLVNSRDNTNKRKRV